MHPDPLLEAILLDRLTPIEAAYVRRAVGISSSQRWRTRLDARDEAIRSLARSHYADLSTRAAAARLALALSRRTAKDPAVGAGAGVQVLLQEVLRLSEGAVLGAEQIRKILRGIRSPLRG